MDAFFREKRIHCIFYGTYWGLFADNDPKKPPLVRWRGHANLLFNNWLNYYVYQETPYDLQAIQNEE